jgi:signal transduction histidine kinase
MASVLDVPLSRILRVVAGSNDLSHVASVGWGDAPLPLPGPRAHSYVDFVMSAREPVRVSDLRQEQRFRVPDVLLDRGVRSSIGCALRGPRGPWGLLSAHSLDMREFVDDECAFVNELANTLSLAIAVKEAQQLHRDTISIASHELRTPLTSVIGLGQHLGRRLSRAGAEEAIVEMATSLTSEAFRLNAIIERWMGFAELHSGSARATVQRIDLRETVLRQVNAALDRHEAMVIDARLPDEPVEIDSAPDAIAGILDNLFENAARYAGEDCEIEVALWCEPDHVLLRVRDNGPGIAESQIPHLFERFYRGNGRVKGGLGIGLYVCRALAEELGGVLTVQNAPDTGAAFTLELPMRPPRRGILDASEHAAAR